MYPLVFLLAAHSAHAPGQLPPPPGGPGGFPGHVTFAPPALPGTPQPAPAPPRRDVILLWNNTLLNVIKADRTPPPLAARNLAMMHAAMYDAVNGILRTYRVYRVGD